MGNGVLVVTVKIDPETFLQFQQNRTTTLLLLLYTWESGSKRDVEVALLIQLERPQHEEQTWCLKKILESQTNLVKRQLPTPKNISDGVHEQEGRDVIPLLSSQSNVPAYSAVFYKASRHVYAVYQRRT